MTDEEVLEEFVPVEPELKEIPEDTDLPEDEPVTDEEQGA